jgi:hypothetical protein
MARPHQPEIFLSERSCTRESSDAPLGAPRLMVAPESGLAFADDQTIAERTATMALAPSTPAIGVFAV